MNILLIAAVLFFILAKNQKNDLAGLLQGVSVEDAISLLKSFGINETLADSLSELIPKIMSGNADITGILKSVLPIVVSLSKNRGSFSQNNSEKNDDMSIGEGISPIGEFAPQIVTDGLKSYFE